MHATVQTGSYAATCCFVFDSTKIGLFSRDRNSHVKLLRLYRNTEFGSALYFQVSIKLESFDLSFLGTKYAWKEREKKLN